MSDIPTRLEEQRERIRAAARAVGRDPDSVTLIAVSKRHGVDAIRAAYEAGQRDFGENYVQEMVEKAKQLSDLPDLRFHFIGHLQSNKARFLTGLVQRVHTVSSPKLARELGKRMGQLRSTDAAPGPWVSFLPDGSPAPLGVLVEVNVGGEDSKSGCAPEQIGSVLSAIDEQPLLEARGLMTIPPFTEDPREARSYFDQLMALREANGGAARLPEMSFGMSADAEIAVAVGATHVRIGTAIFGPRPT